MRLLIGFVTLIFATSCTPDSETIDLAAWESVGEPVWSITAAGAKAGPTELQGNLVSPTSYSDFILRVDFRIDDETNSGVFVRCGSVTGFGDINPFNCYEINIWDNHPNQDFRTGSIVRLKPPDLKVSTLHGWNSYEIIARGSEIQVKLNGRLVNQLDNAELIEGRVALQYWGKKELEFRNLRIRSL